MSTLVWDKAGEKRFETGVDRGVLYLQDGSAVVWNGLTSVTESPNIQSSPTYYDGRKISDLVSIGDYAGNLRAYTYPDEFLEFEGYGKYQNGVWLGDQRPKAFGLSYRNTVGNDVDGNEAGHKIHVLYNVLASPKDKSFATMGDSLSAVEFEWDLSAIPEDISGFAPTAHIIIDTTEIDESTLSNVEEVLYGSEAQDAELISMSALLTLIGVPTLLAVEIIDNGDGTWTAIGDSVVDNGDGSFTITNANSVSLDADTYRISSTHA